MDKALGNISDNFSSELTELEQSIKQSGKSSAKSIDIKILEEKISHLRVKFLGGKSELNQLLRGLKDLETVEEKKDFGQKVNNLKEKIQADINQRFTELSKHILQIQLKNEEFPAELIGRKHPQIIKNTISKKHIVSQTINRIEDIFLKMGFNVEYSYEIDTEYNAFDAVNIPENHPARDNWDTLWLDSGLLAIPHTSAMQNRILKSKELPIKTVIIGKCFRNEATDATHEHTFYQVEGVYLDKNVSMADMLGIMVEFLENFFETKDLEYKFTPDFFPFVEPGGQMAISKEAIGNSSLKSKSEYLEILGCGMIHPNVLEMAEQNPNEVSGFAWGLGLERLILLKYGIEDIRLFNSGDLKFSRQF